MAEYIEREAAMDVREKLVELIGSTGYGNGSLVGNNFQKGFIEKIATHLIANGVTAQKWIPVTERLPEEEGIYLVAVVNDHERRYSKTAWYHGHGNWFLHQKVTHWMPIPEPPKEK